jgi:hypothetical protein
MVHTYKRQIAMYGAEFMNPTIQEFLSQVAALAGSLQNSPVSGIPSAGENVRLAPFDPVVNVSR